MNVVTRRDFMAAAAGVYFGSLAGPVKAGMSNDELRVVVIGGNGIGKTHLDGFPEIAGVKVVGFCDVDSAVRGKREEEFSKKHQVKLKLYEDMRKVFDDREVDAVVLAVPNHWHGLGTVWGCQAEKDVYTEKPCSHNIWEAGQMAKAALKYQRIVQVGIQRRSFEHLKNYFAEVQQGALGKVKSVRGLYLSRRASIGKPQKPVLPIPTVNHDLWCGPGSTKLDRANYHYDWHWFWEYGNAELGNNGPHILDLCRWAIGAEEFPTSVTSVGGRYVWDDNGETPNTHLISYEFPQAPVIFEIRDLPDSKTKPVASTYQGLSYGIVIEGEEGTFLGFDQGRVLDKDGKIVREIKGDVGTDGGRQLHRINFVKAVRSRNPTELNCSIRAGHLSTALCHLGNISHRLGTAVELKSLMERLPKESFLTEACGRMTEHLVGNGVAETAEINLGKTLSIDVSNETFRNDPGAMELLRREYRAPYIVPEEV